MMKADILQQLRASTDVVSGEVLSDLLGVSRVSVWKHIRKLQESGYAIVSTPKGYRLEGAPDTPYPWEFPEMKDRIHYFPEIGSTMDAARDLARTGCPDLTVAVADVQTKGRGRLARTWLSDRGGLFFTMVIRPEIPPFLAHRLNFLASVTLAGVLERLFDVPARVKWPNDILVNERKICGMLSEMAAAEDGVEYVSIGMGINVNNDPADREPNAVSLIGLLGRPVSRREILSIFLGEFEKRLQHLDYDAVIPEWKRWTITLNRRVRIVTTEETSEGIAEDVDPDGALILRMADGTRKRIIYGDCFL